MYRVISDYCANERGSHRAVTGSFPESVVFVTTKIKSRQSEVYSTNPLHLGLDNENVQPGANRGGNQKPRSTGYGLRQEQDEGLGVQYFEFRPPATVPKVDIVRGKELHLGWNPSPET
ncbi:hypothetical protein B0H13DRAFT_1878963 [Mycena leptocephala]|nr:hypothetical protein B0H13DRAFT_1878963 [Mycena leptocephala]